MKKPWYNTDDLINSIKRKISFPIYQSTFTDQDIIDFINEELFISQVPSIMEYHEEYLVFRVVVPLKPNQSRYAIPYRAIGMKLRDLFWTDVAGNFFEMTRCSSEDRSFFQARLGVNAQPIYKYYIEGNDIVLMPSITEGVTGSLSFFIFIRPNQLVTTDRAAIIRDFTKTITLSNADIAPGDTLTFDGIVFTAVSGSPGSNEFQIGGTSAITAANLASTLNTNGVVSAEAASGVVRIYYSDLNLDLTTSNSTGFSIQTTQGIRFTSDLNSIFTEGSLIDLLQEKPGHQIYKYDIKIPMGGIITSQIIDFPASSLKTYTNTGNETQWISLQAGDYICLANEAIIPQIPPDLHNVLAERASARILAAIGDQAGLQASNQKIADMEKRTGTLVDSRVDGSPKKVTNRHSFLHFNKRGLRRF